MTIIQRGISASLLLALVACTSRSAAPASLRFRSLGGDVWAFEETVALEVGRACVAVRLAGPDGEVEARPRGGRVEMTLPLRTGDNRIEARCLDAHGRVRARDTRTDIVRLSGRPEVALRVSPDLVLAAAAVPSEDDDAALRAYEFVDRGTGPSALYTSAGEPLPHRGGPSVALAMPSADGTYEVEVEVSDARGREGRAAAVFHVVRGRVEVPPLDSPPRWLETAIVYGIAPFLYGGLDGVRAELPRLAALGVDTLWLTPVQDTPEGDFGYEVRDHFTPRAELGGAAALTRLVEAAHARGMRVVADFVPSHTSRDHVYFAHAEAHGARSPYRAFYARDDLGEPTHYFDWEHLPSLAVERPEVRRMLVEAAVSWVERFDLDGLRVDVAWGVERRAPGFLAELRTAVRRIAPEAIILAEMGAREAPQSADVAYDWGDAVGTWAWKDVFDEGHVDLAELRRALRSTPIDRPVLRFLENNDTGERFHTAHGDDVHAVAATMLFTLPGVPCLFAGEEATIAYEPYQRETPLPREDDPATFAHLAALAELRRAEPALRDGAFRLLDVAPRDAALAFLREPREVGRPVLVVIGFGETPTEVEVAIEPEALRRRGWTERFGDGAPARSTSAGVRIQLAPRSGRVFVAR